MNILNQTSKTKLLYGVLIAALAQTAVLGWMVYDRIALLRDGREIVLDVVPVDPRSIFRGDYVRLAYPISRAPAHKFSGDATRRHVAVYVTLVKGEAQSRLSGQANSLPRLKAQNSKKAPLRARPPAASSSRPPVAPSVQAPPPQARTTQAPQAPPAPPAPMNQAPRTKIPVTPMLDPGVVYSRWKVLSVRPFYEPPRDQNHVVLKARVMRPRWQRQGSTASLRLKYGIERYFVEEGRGRALERLVGVKRLSILVAVAPSGQAAIKGLLIDGVLQYSEPLL